MVLLLSWGVNSPLPTLRTSSLRTCVPSGLVAPSTRERVGCSPLLGVPGLQGRGATPRPTGTTPFVPLGTGVRVSDRSAPLRTTDIGTCSLLTSLTFCPCRAGLRLENPGFTPGSPVLPRRACLWLKSPFRSGQLTVSPSSFFRSWPVAITPVSWGVGVVWTHFPTVWVNLSLPQLPSADGLSLFPLIPPLWRCCPLDFPDSSLSRRRSSRH